jgi:hypothetical protein
LEQNAPVVTKAGYHIVTAPFALSTYSRKFFYPQAERPPRRADFRRLTG